MKAITYDPVNDIFYFTDRKHPLTSIFSLKVRDDTTFLTAPLVPRSEKEVIEDLIYDVHDNALYWSDSGNKIIVKLVFDRSKNLKWQKQTFLNVSGDIAGLEIDSCQRNLYYTIVSETNPSINMLSLDKKEGESAISFGNENHFKPVAIAMDHQNRRLYVADVRKYNSYSIDSISVNGTEFRTEIDTADKTPRSLAVDDDFVYYVEGQQHELRRFKKSADKKASESFKVMPFDPYDIIVRSNYITDLDSKKCKLSESKINQVKQEMLEKILKKEEPNNKQCLHGGLLEKTTSSCMCTENFDGDFCEINLCYNFCLNGGDCSMIRNEKSQSFEPKCSCKRGFVGEHCEVDVCTNYCLNNGHCSISYNKEPKCGCNEKFNGARCENLKFETLPLLIESRADAKSEIESTSTTFSSTLKMQDFSEYETKIQQKNPETLLKTGQENVRREMINCPQNPNWTFVILAVCVSISLLLFLTILLVIKKINRPMRPRIRKKFVVHKNIEPLTYRPTTEQCEVIIEDCCNMNICETVGFFYSLSAIIFITLLILF